MLSFGVNISKHTCCAPYYYVPHNSPPPRPIPVNQLLPLLVTNPFLTAVCIISPPFVYPDHVANLRFLHSKRGLGWRPLSAMRIWEHEEHFWNISSRTGASSQSSPHRHRIRFPQASLYVLHPFLSLLVPFSLKA